MDEGRQRLLIAGGTLAVLAALIVLILVFSGGEEREFDPPDQACIDDWNDDGAALSLGQHQFQIHRYQRLEVTHVTKDGTKTAEGSPGALCTVIFSASVLDAEISSTAQILRPVGWVPLSGAGVPSQRLADLQVGAQETYNATLQANGEIEPL